MTTAMSEIDEFVSIGDLHLTDSLGRGGLAAHIKEPDKMVADLVIAQPLKWARKKGIRDIILLGDLCENPRMSYEGQMQLSRIFQQKGFIFHVILGNHDKLAEDSAAGHSLQLMKALGLRENVRLYEEPTKVGRLNFLPWPHAKFDKERMNIAHIDVQGSKTDSGRLNKSEKLNASQADAVIGHIHTAQKVRNSHYPGTIYQKNFGESLDKYFGHSRFDDGWETNLIPVQPTYRLHTIEVKSRKDLKKVPASEFDLIKLIIVDGAKVTAADYQHLNVKAVKTASTEQELALARIEELSEGSEVEISTDEFFGAWLERQPKDDDLKAKAEKVRAKYLKGHAR
jgi:DNA repair exonuclease SbcCD nuclease subunit